MCKNCNHPWYKHYPNNALELGTDICFAFVVADAQCGCRKYVFGRIMEKLTNGG
jgi:hypothetical protein